MRILSFPFACSLCISDNSSRTTRPPNTAWPSRLARSCETVEYFAAFEVSDWLFGERERGEERERDREH